MASDTFDRWWDAQPHEQDGGPEYGSSAKGWDAAVEECAAVVEAVGCSRAADCYEGEHGRTCPRALAARLRKLVPHV